MASVSRFIAAAAAVLLPNAAAFIAIPTSSMLNTYLLRYSCSKHDRRRLARSHSTESFRASVNDDYYTMNNIRDGKFREATNRRVFLGDSILTINASAMLGLAPHANAAKGAAEYDLEYYFRDLV